MDELCNAEEGCDELARRLYDEPLDRQRLSQITAGLMRLAASLEPVIDEYRKAWVNPDKSFAINAQVRRIQSSLMWVHDHRRAATDAEVCERLDAALHAMVETLWLLANRRDEERVRWL